MKALEVFALDDTFQRASGSIPYTTLVWDRRYNSPGEFLMEIPANIYDKEWAYIYADDRPETGIIQKVEFSDTSHIEGGIDTITLSGFFTEAWLNNYVFLEETTVEETYLVYVAKPVKPVVQEPTIWKDAAGNYYMSRQTSGGKTVYYDKDGNETGIPESGTKSLTEVKSTPAPGTSRPAFSQSGSTAYTNNWFTTESGGEITLTRPHDGWSWTYSVENNFKNAGVTIYKDEAGQVRWTGSGATLAAENDYRRRLENWEAHQDSIVKWTSLTSGYYEATRKVMSPFSLRVTDMNEVGASMDNAQYVVKWAQRLFGAQMLYDKPDFTGEVKVVNPSMMAFGDLCYQELATIGASVRLFYSFRNDSLVFQVWRGLDRTQSQTNNPWAVFSDTWGTLYDYSASKDVSNYKNKCYTLYDYDMPTSWDASGAPEFSPVYEPNADKTALELVAWEIPYQHMQGYETYRIDDGLPDAEVYLDKRNDKPEDDGQWPKGRQSGSERPSKEAEWAGMRDRYSKYSQSISETGKRYLEENYKVVTNLDTGTLVLNAYMEDWDLGDKVDMSIDTIGMKSETRITEVVETHEAGSSTVSITIGDELVSIVEKAVNNA